MNPEHPTDNAGAPELPWTGERLVPSLAGDIVLEHLHRYALALDLASGADVLDIASGEGYGAWLLALRARSVVGVDADPATVEHARRKYVRPNLRFLPGRCPVIPLADASVDLVVSFETLEHFVEHEEFLGEVRRVLRPGGRFIVSTPDRPIYTGRLGNRNPFHPRELDLAEFEALLGGRFAHALVLSQRVALGSFMAPVQGGAGCDVGTHRGDWNGLDYTPGAAEGVYLIGVASDAPLPPLRAGLFEFGRAEVSGFVTPLARDRAAHAETLRPQVTALQREAAELRTQVAELSAQLDARRREIAEFSAQAEQARRHAADLTTQLETRCRDVAELSAQLERLRHEAAELGAQAEQSRQHAAGLQEQLADTARRLDEERARHVHAEEALRQRNESLQATAASALRWQERSWFQRAFHRWRPPGVSRSAAGFFRRLERSFRKRRKRLVLRWRTWLAVSMAVRAPAESRPATAPQQAGAADVFRTLAATFRPPAAARELYRQAAVIEHSGLFDPHWYDTQFAEDEEIGIEPAMHYLLEGAVAGRDPNPIFDSQWYWQQNPDVARAGRNPLVHYLERGVAEGRDPGPQFSVRYYLESNPDVAGQGIEPLTHYLRAGLREGRLPKPPEPDFSDRVDDTLRFDTAPDPDPAPAPLDVRAIAFYLPQFHCIPENDAWWGEGFTEWTNVRQGGPQFAEHAQPQVPHPDVGYYDLSDPAVLERQARLARRFGIHGFCFYHYWFGGRRVLEMPVERLLKTRQPDFPFCLCWANENWTRRWDGMDSEILLAQEHSPENDERFIRDLLPAFRDPRYIRIEGRPLFLVYRPLLLPDPAAAFARWREVCRREGIGEIFLAGVQGLGFVDPRPLGLDAAVEFPPHDTHVVPLDRAVVKAVEGFRGNIFDYRQARFNMLHRKPPAYPLFRGVMPAWDNTARRRESATIFTRATPAAYYAWLRQIVDTTRATQTGDRRLVFINAWNEWAEGCHLEPDERDGYAWLNATGRALLPAGTTPAPAPPPPMVVEIPPAVTFPDLPERPHLSISVLFYYKEELMAPFVEAITPQIEALVSDDRATCSLHLVLNYPASAGVRDRLAGLVERVVRSKNWQAHIRENACNKGFGAAHNEVFQTAPSDVFLILNSDVQIGDPRWLREVLRRFAAPDVALVGLRETASRLRADACGIPVPDGETAFDFVDGSALAIRSEAARRFGLFSEDFPFFYFEDVDLSLRFRQVGLRTELLDVPYTHHRSASTVQLPRYVVERILDHNRARFFDRWQPFLASRRLSNRLGLQFTTLDRTVQCASLPALFGLLARHPAAVLDVTGVHADLEPLFAHPRLRRQPANGPLPRENYFQCWTVGQERKSELPLALAIASELGVQPDFVATRQHLESLADKAPATAVAKKHAVFFLARPSPLFPGREPAMASQLQLRDHLRQRGLEVAGYTDCAEFELPGDAAAPAPAWRRLARDGLQPLLRDLTGASLVVAPDHFVLQLAQMLRVPAFGWFGATSPTRRVWRWDCAGFFSDDALDCAGCHHRWGTAGRSFCLRGDEACTNAANLPKVLTALEQFLAGTAPTPAKLVALDQSLAGWQRRVAGQVDLSRWPATQARSVLLLAPVHPRMDPAARRRAEDLARRATAGIRDCRIVFDSEGEAPPRGAHPVRQTALAAIRQGMIERHLRDEAWVFWVDADIVEYPEQLIEMLIERAEGGVAAPFVLMEGGLHEPALNPDGFGPGRFYDVAGFVENGRWARFEQPYFDQPGPVINLDSVGSCYLVNADLYRHGARHEMDPACAAFLASKAAWDADTLRRNQRGPANCFTEHYTVCQFARRQGLPVRAFADLVVRHERG